MLRLAGTVAIGVGDVLASGIGDVAPKGFLVKATAVRSEGGDTVIDVVPATLLEAIPEANIDETVRLEAGRRVRRSFRRRVDCTSGGTVTIEGSADLGTPELNVKARWGFSLFPKAVELSASVTASAEASASASGAASCTVGPIEIAKIHLPSVTVPLPIPVPLVLTPEIEIELSGLGEIEASVATSFNASLTAKAGAKYEDDDLSPIAEVDKNFDFTPPDPTGSAKLNATLSSELDLEVYGVAGPELGFNLGLEVNASPDTEPSWTLDAPVSFTVGIDIDVLNIDVGPITVYEKRFRLAEAAPRYGTAEAELTMSTSETGSGASGACSDGKPISLNASGDVRAASTKATPVTQGDSGPEFDFADTEPALTAIGLSGQSSFQCEEGTNARESILLQSPGHEAPAGDPKLPYRFELPATPDGAVVPDAPSVWELTGDGDWFSCLFFGEPFLNESCSDENYAFPTRLKVEPPDAGRQRQYPLGNLLGRWGYDFDGKTHYSGTATPLEQTSSTPSPGVTVLKGGVSYVEQGNWWVGARGGSDGPMTYSHTVRWTITLRRGSSVSAGRAE